MNPVNRISAGHVGHLQHPSEDSIYYQGEVFIPRAAPHPGTIKIEGQAVPPYINFSSDSSTTSNESFIVFGPWYSLVFETALKLNYSIVGTYPLSNQLSALWIHLMEFRPDILLCPLMPNNEAMIRSIEVGYSSLSKLIGIFEFDHFLSPRKYCSESLLALLTPFDKISLLLIAIAMLFASVFVTKFNCDKILKEVFNGSNIIWNLLTALIYCPNIATKSLLWRFIGLTWLFGTVILNWIFAGEMFTAMTFPPDLNVVQSWSDLAFNFKNITISVFDSVDGSGDYYNSKATPYYEQLAPRFKVLMLEETYNENIIKEVVHNVSTGIQVQVGIKHILEQYITWFENRESEFFISDEFGQYMPSFLGVSPYAEKAIVVALNKIIEQTSESGIFNQWVAAYTKNRYQLPKSLAEYDVGEMRHYKGVVVICAMMLSFSFLTLVSEMLYNVYNKTFREENVHLFERVNFN